MLPNTIKNYEEIVARAEQIETKNLDILMQQHKQYVELMDRVSQRRLQANQFYLSLISALAGFMSVLYHMQGTISTFSVLGLAGLGLIICILWWMTILSYRQLNTGKFVVITEIEKKLAYPCFQKEWEALGKGKNKTLYRRLSKTESLLPIAMGSICVAIILGIAVALLLT